MALILVEFVVKYLVVAARNAFISESLEVIPTKVNVNSIVSSLTLWVGNGTVEETEEGALDLSIMGEAVVGLRLGNSVVRNDGADVSAKLGEAVLSRGDSNEGAIEGATESNHVPVGDNVVLKGSDDIGVGATDTVGGRVRSEKSST